MDTTGPVRIFLNRILPWLIAAAFIVLVQYVEGWARVLAAWREISWLTALGALLLVFASYAVRAQRLYLHFRPALAGHWLGCLKLMLYHNFLNNLLPLRTGEVSFPVLMGRYFGVEARASVPALLWFRVLDLHSLLAYGVLVFGGFYLGWRGGAALLGLWLVVPIPLVRLRDRLLGLFERLSPGRVRGALTALVETVPARFGDVLWVWLLSALNWGLKLYAFALILVDLLGVGAAQGWMGALGGDLTSALPIHSAAGLGTYEAGVVAGMALLGVAPGEALRGAVNLHLFLLVAMGLGALLGSFLPRPAMAVKGKV
ncbi:MAG: lysylphosphatidylglycerol synthase transmembrane domain-containing protein [Gammaproteobacteria bacterium]|jgi:uncharacterized membrane protein YbhN (UPF0104 family)